MLRLKALRQSCMRDGARSSRIPTSWMCTGSIQNAWMSEIASASVTTKGIMNMKSPTMPGSSISGMKAAMVVATEASTGFQTSAMPSRLACSAFWPRSMR